MIIKNNKNLLKPSSFSGSGGHNGGDNSGDDSSSEGSISSLTDHHATIYRRNKVKRHSLNDMSDALRHRVVLALQEAGMLDKDERLTEKAIRESEAAMKKGKLLRNREVENELTRDGSHIEDWEKRKTGTIIILTGQRIQIHFYKNKLTNEVNYTHRDFKIKDRVNPTMTDGKKYKENQLDELLKPRK